MAKTLSTHILDLSCGRPAANVPIRVEHFIHEQWVLMSAIAKTNNDGRAFDLVPLDKWQAGRWRIIFDVSSYMPDAFFSMITIEFCTANAAHRHVPLLLNKFGYSTYLGS